LVEEAYTQQGRAHIRRPHPDWAAFDFSLVLPVLVEALATNAA
jgi:hypothetical protein